MTRLSCTNLLTTSPNFYMLVKLFKLAVLVFSLLQLLVTCSIRPRLLIFYSFSHKKSLFSKISDDVIACDLRFNPPLLYNLKSRIRLCIKPSAICIPDTSCCILVLLTHIHEWLLTILRKRKAAKYTLHCFQSKISLVWKYEIEYGRKFQYGMKYRMEDF